MGERYRKTQGAVLSINFSVTLGFFFSKLVSGGS